MNGNEWEKFFDLLCDIVDMPNMSYTEKIAEIKKQAHEYGEQAEVALEEFGSWDFE